MTDILGPASAPNATTSRPSEGRTFSTQDSWFKDCSSGTADDGTDIQANWLNGVIGALRSVWRGNGMKADGITAIVPELGTDDTGLLTAVSHLIQRGQPQYAEDTSGTAGVITATLTPATAEYKNGLTVAIKAAHTSGPGTVLNLGGLGGIPVVRMDGSALRNGDIPAASVYSYRYSAGRFQLLGTGAGSGLTVIATAVAYYVNPVSGNDANDGTTTGTAWATLNHAYQWLQQNINANGQTITINCAFPTNPTAYAPFTATGGIVGVFSAGQLQIVGDTSAHACVISVTGTSQNAIGLGSLAMASISGFTLISTGSQGCGITASGGAQVVINNCAFGACSAYHIQAFGPGSQASPSSGNIFNGSCFSSLRASQSAIVQTGGGITMTYNGITCSGGTVSAVDLGTIVVVGASFAGAGVNGPRFSISMNSVLDTNGAQASAGAAYLPGTSAGTTASGGQFQ